MKTNNFQKVKLNRQSSGKSNPTPAVPTQGASHNDKLLELRAKIEHERSIMRQSGKRFQKGTPVSNILTTTQQIASTGFTKKQNNAVQVSVGDDIEKPALKVEEKIDKKQPKRTTVDLTSLVADSEDISLSSSRVFEQQHLQQKGRNKEVQDFLSKVGLGSFAEGLISLGYDELQVLLEVTAEELNFLMMRASQQRVLAQAFKHYKIQHDIEQGTSNTNPSFASTSTYFHSKVKNQAPKEQKLEKPESKHENSVHLRPKSALTIASTTPTNNSGVFNSYSPNPSFFIGIGGGDWSMDSLVRRACGICFRVFPGGDMIKDGQNYYCQKCKQSEEEDPLGVSLNSSMVRDYHF